MLALEINFRYIKDLNVKKKSKIKTHKTPGESYALRKENILLKSDTKSVIHKRLINYVKIKDFSSSKDIILSI